MQFEADLDVVVDGSEAHVTGRGSTLVVESADPVALVTTLRRAAGSRARSRLAPIADRLAASGSSVHVEGPRGPYLMVGADADSRIAQVLTGTRHVAPARRAVRSIVPRVPRRAPALVVAALAAGVAIAALRRHHAI